MIDLGRMTTEQTQTLLGDCVDNLTLQQVRDVLEERLGAESRAELAEGWFDIDAD
jgi:hypothetical protein